MSSETESSNPKHKYRQKDKERATPSTVEQTHRQKAPLLLTMDDGLTVSKDEEISLDVSREDLIRESAEALSSDANEYVGGSLLNTAGEELIVDEGLTDTVDRTENDDNSLKVDFTDQDNQVGIKAEETVRTKDVVDQFEPDEIGAHYLEDAVPRVQEGHESDEEEKKAILAEENVLQLEEAEKV